jgi:hypothetical protein
VWIHGFWAWSGRWVWVAGHWHKGNPGLIWIGGHWAAKGNKWHWEAGRWATESELGEERPGDPIAHSAPPALLAEAASADLTTASGHVWVAGHWAWRGHWDWVHGHWHAPPRKGAKWVPGQWTQKGKSWHWGAGHWG